MKKIILAILALLTLSSFFHNNTASASENSEYCIYGNLFDLDSKLYTEEISVYLNDEFIGNSKDVKIMEEKLENHILLTGKGLKEGLNELKLKSNGFREDILKEFFFSNLEEIEMDFCGNGKKFFIKICGNSGCEASILLREENGKYLDYIKEYNEIPVCNSNDCGGNQATYESEQNVVLYFNIELLEDGKEYSGNFSISIKHGNTSISFKGNSNEKLGIGNGIPLNKELDFKLELDGFETIIKKIKFENEVSNLKFEIERTKIDYLNFYISDKKTKKRLNDEIYSVKLKELNSENEINLRVKNGFNIAENNPLNVGNYELEIEKVGYETYFKEIEFGKMNNITIPLELKRTNNPSGYLEEEEKPEEEEIIEETKKEQVFIFNLDGSYIDKELTLARKDGFELEKIIIDEETEILRIEKRSNEIDFFVLINSETGELLIKKEIAFTTNPLRVNFESLEKNENTNKPLEEVLQEQKEKSKTIIYISSFFLLIGIFVFVIRFKKKYKLLPNKNEKK